MGAYLVESGSVRMAVTADNARKAALWAVHCSVSQVRRIYDDDSWTVEEKERAARHQARQVLDAEVVVGEQGPVHCRTWRFDTMELVAQWHDLMVALSDLDRRLSAETHEPHDTTARAA